ncbi:MAG TPA: hypothetical protein VJS44_04780 [Pyrinomonadaceae bacterium]|nr:hypothetical protein [Pyrinomonadaceae bacterium]
MSTANNQQTALATRATSTEMNVFEVGRVLAESGFFQDSKGASQAIAKILAGRELGLGPVASMTGIYIVKGRVTLSANVIAAAIKRSARYNYKVLRMEDDGCEIEFYEDGQPVGKSKFDADDARLAGLLAGDNWRKFPRNMYFARAISNGAKWFTPDIFAGPVYTPDELGEQVTVREDGEMEVITSEPALPAVTAPVESAQPVNSRETIDDGVERSELIHKIRQECVGLGYDETKTQQAVSKATAMTTTKMRDALESLKKLRAKKEIEAKRAEVLAIFAEHEWDEGDVERYLKQSHGGVAINDMSLDQLIAVIDDMAGVRR